MSNKYTAEAPLLLTIEEAALKLGLGRSTIYALVNGGELPTVRIGRAVRLPVKDLEIWVENKKQRV